MQPRRYISDDESSSSNVSNRSQFDTCASCSSNTRSRANSANSRRRVQVRSPRRMQRNVNRSGNRSVNMGRSRGRKCYNCNERGTKIYCGSKCYLPNDSYTRFGTPFECLQKGIYVGKVKAEANRRRGYYEADADDEEY